MNFTRFTRKFQSALVPMSLLLALASTCFAEDSAPYCYLSGAFNQRPGRSGVNSGGMIRMQYQASDEESCISITKEVCTKNRDEGLVPDGLVITFRKHMSDSKSQRFSLTRDCVVNKK